MHRAWSTALNCNLERLLGESAGPEKESIAILVYNYRPFFYRHAGFPVVAAVCADFGPYA